MRIDEKVLPFAAQLIGTACRALGWGTELHLDDPMTSATNSAFQKRLNEMCVAIDTKPETAQVVYVERGRIRLEKIADKRVKAYLFLGELNGM